MTPFVRHTGVACALPAANIDTDQIVPKQFLKTITRVGLAAGLFYDQRHDQDGRKIGGFVLDTPPFDTATILVAGDNFGCGSSREHAPWALLDFGFRCVISTSFADIFFNNSVNNGLLPVVVDAAAHAELLAVAGRGGTITVDLERQTVGGDASEFVFDIAPASRRRLLAGLDPIGEALLSEGAIHIIEQRLAEAMPWLPPTSQLEVQNAE